LIKLLFDLLIQGQDLGLPPKPAFEFKVKTLGCHPNPLLNSNSKPWAAAQTGPKGGVNAPPLGTPAFFYVAWVAALVTMDVFQVPQR